MATTSSAPLLATAAKKAADLCPRMLEKLIRRYHSTPVALERAFHTEVTSSTSFASSSPPVATEVRYPFAGVTLWKPDPVSGNWVPEAAILSSGSSLRSTVAAHSDSASETRFRSIPRASMDERAWWSSEEFPMDRSFRSSA
ncbi:hypothetical protein CLOM_g4503 [Closterium sp. NIES-68]|nr:hypothetical protein CLOM_g4503 [Closterium sp. NIES-68]GJP80852.1 hypothetical protein CLOP_g11051 [Closterium sp. NIES-67]